MMDRKFKFSFPERNVQDSIVFSMVSEFKIEPSILRAAIDDDGCGILILRLKGPDELVEKALRYAEDQDVEIDELGDHIMRDEQRKGSIIRAILQVLAIVNQIIAGIGKSSFASADWYQWLSVGVLIAISLVNMWENVDITKLATFGTKLVDALQDGKITIEEAQGFLEKKEEEKE